MLEWLTGSSDQRLMALADRYVSASPLPPETRTTDLALRFMFLSIMRNTATAGISSVDRTGYVGGSDALKSEAELKAELKRKADSWIPIEVQQALSTAQGLTTSTKAWRDFVLLSYDRADAGLMLHAPAYAQELLASGKMSRAELDADWERRYRTYDFLAYLHRNKQLEPIKIGSQLTGLGTVESVIIIVLAIALVVFGVVYIVTSAIHQTQVNQLAKDMVQTFCFDRNTGRPVESEACTAARKQANNIATSKTAQEELLGKLPFYLLLGLGVYLAGQVFIARETGRAMRGPS